MFQIRGNAECNILKVSYCLSILRISCLSFMDIKGWCGVMLCSLMKYRLLHNIRMIKARGHEMGGTYSANGVDVKCVHNFVFKA
jgi:hypothetical protein